MSTEGRIFVRARWPNGGMTEVVLSPRRNRDKPGDTVEVWRDGAGPTYVKLGNVFDRPKGKGFRFRYENVTSITDGPVSS